MRSKNRTQRFASASQLWRLNMLGLLAINDEPAEPLERREAKEILAEAVKQGLWNPARGERGPVRGGL